MSATTATPRDGSSVTSPSVFDGVHTTHTASESYTGLCGVFSQDLFDDGAYAGKHLIGLLGCLVVDGQLS